MLRNEFVGNFPQYYQHICIAHYPHTERPTQVTPPTLLYVFLIQSAIRALNSMLPVCKLNFAQVYQHIKG